MSMRNFLRDYRFTAGVAGARGFEIGIPSPEALHISFSIEKSEAKSPNTAKFTVWNLNPTQIAMLEQKDCVVTLHAGYDGRRPLAFVGNVTYVSTEDDVSDVATQIEASDSRAAIRDAYLSFAYKEKVNTKIVFEYIAKQMGVPVIFSERCKFVDLLNYSYTGAAKGGLDKLCTLCGLVWSLQNGVLQIRPPNEPITMRAFLLSPDTGLIGTPKRIVIGEKGAGTSDKTKAQTGWEVQYFLNPAIGINDYVSLQSARVKGNFRVSKLWMDGDNLEGDWLCRAELLGMGK